MGRDMDDTTPEGGADMAVDHRRVLDGYLGIGPRTERASIRTQRWHCLRFCSALRRMQAGRSTLRAYGHLCWRRF